jgi:MFS transporter, DHA3 family, tetracycline resistance protein
MKFEKKSKSLSYGIDFTHGMRRALTSALILIYFISLGFNVIAVTTLLAISTLIMTFFEFPTGAVADYDSRKKSILISFLLMFISFLGIFLFRNFWVLAGFWILSDIAWTFSSGANSAWIVDTLNYAKEKSKLIKLISVGFTFEKLGQFIGGLVGLLIVAISFKFIWLVISLSYLLLFFISLKYMEERNFKPEKTPHNYLKKSLIKAKESFLFLLHKHNGDVRILMWTEFLIVVGFAGFYVGMPLLFTQIFGLGPEHISGIHAIVGALLITTPLLANKIAHKSKFGKSLFLFCLFLGVFLVAFALSRSLIVAIVSFALIKSALSIFDTLIDSARAHLNDSKIRASLGSITSITWSAASSIGIFLAGISINFLGIINTLLISGGIIFLTAFIFLGMRE